MNKKFNSKPIYEDKNNNKYMKAKIIEYGDNIETNFHDNKIAKEITLTMLESVFRTNKEYYYPQIFIEECKYEEKTIKTNKRIDYDFDKSSFDESDNEPDDETDSEPHNESDSEPEKSSKKSDNNKSEESSKKSD